jgi:hypothetical protein
MAATHMVQRVNGPASVMREPLFGPCASVVAPSTDVGRYTSCPQLMLRRVVLRGSARLRLVRGAAVGTALLCLSSFPPHAW